MTPESVQLQREELYEQVWTEPMIHLAQRYGLSGVALAKICRKMAVPVPPRGYWQRKKFGNAPPRPPLPAPSERVRSLVTLRPRPHSVRQSGAGPAGDDPAGPPPPKDPIPVPDRLVRPHPLVRVTRETLRREKVDDYGRLSPHWNDRCLDIRVAKASLARALRIMDTLIKALEARGFPVRVADGREPGTHVEILDEKVRFKLEEAIQRTDHVPTPAELERQKRWSWERPPQWDYAATGLLRLRAEEYVRGTRKLWSDGRTQRLEEMLTDVVRGLVLVAEAKRTERAECERRQRELREAAERQAELERQRREEEARRQALERQAEIWLTTQNLRAYIDAVERAAMERGILAAPGSELQRWLEWARRHADRLDPLKAVLAPHTVGGTAGAQTAAMGCDGSRASSTTDHSARSSMAAEACLMGPPKQKP